ncbi:MAG TPA: hypothetical protein VGL02_29085 [Streptomyces sp.]
MTDLSSSLEQLENQSWEAPPAGATRLVETVHRLRRKPIAEGDYYPGDLLVAVLKVPRDH